MSKSGLFAHFGSKEDLQLATIEEARQRYAREVIEPACAAGSGITRLHALCEAFLSYLERAVFPGGCFFASAMAEFDARHPGPVRDRIAECQDQWMDTLERAAAGRPGNTASCTPAPTRSSSPSSSRQRCCRRTGTTTSSTMPTYLDRARRAVRARLASEATPAGQHLVPPAPQSG